MIIEIFKKGWKILVGIIVILFIVFLLSRGKVYSPDELFYGVTFSQKQAISLGLDWRKLFTDSLSDLNIKKFRLVAYWDEIEKEKGNYYWDDLDWQVDEAGRAGATVILAIGGRLPRWPECHFPEWTNTITKSEREEAALKYIEATIRRYQGKGQIVAWQIENEPFLSHFGNCPPLDSGFLDKEIALAKVLDSRPIIVTDSGELSLWVPAARRADIFGTTMYRDTYSKYLNSYIHYPITPGFFRFKKNVANIFASPSDWIVIELAAEPWCKIAYQDASKEERDITMNLDKFKEILEFSRQAGFKEFYLWGLEWWYWEKETQNNPALWDYARTLYIKHDINKK